LRIVFEAWKTATSGYFIVMRRTIALVSLLQFALANFASTVTVLRAPNGGIQPQAAIASSGVVHLIYYKGKDSAGDIFYVKQNPGENTFSKPIQVNSRPGSAMSIGSIRGAQLALGKNDRVHVIWNGGEGAEKPKIDGKEITPLVYARFNDAGTAFEPERNLITYAGGLDGGSSIAADPFGNVYATWHGRAPGAAEGEAGRAVFIARSTDEGKSFRPEMPATREKTGACGCCGMRAFADREGAVCILYRGAAEKVNRDEILLVSPKPGAPFSIVNKHPWVLESCPMSSASITPADHGAVAAWETAGQIFFTSIDPATKSIGKIQSPPGTTKRRHPVAVTNAKGETLVAWTEGTAWAKGGSAVWQIFDSKGAPALEQSRANDLPTWSLVTACATPDGNFVVIY
jgi:hypothetical protein